MGADLTGFGSGLQVLLGFLSVGWQGFAFVVQTAQQQFGAWLFSFAAFVDVGHQLVGVAQFGEVVYQLCQADPGRRVGRGYLLEQVLGGFFSSVWPRLRSASTRATLSTRVAGTAPRA